MANELPQLTKDFMAHIESEAKKGIVSYDIEGIKINLFPYIFPPQSGFSDSSHGIYNFLGNVKGKRLLDLGCGSGIQGIKGAKAGAKHVTAVDINPVGVACSQHNVVKNGVADIVDVHYSDMFSHVEGRYDVIIANLPILDADCDEKYLSLCDPGFSAHKRLFSEAGNYSVNGTKILLTHANLQGDEAFTKLEDLAKEHNYIARSIKLLKNINTPSEHEWRRYEFEHR